MGQRTFKNILVTGGAGFIGVNFIQFLFSKTDFSGRVINWDKLTYAGNPSSLAAINSAWGNRRYFFECGDVCDKTALTDILNKYQIDCVVHFAAESHVDRSIHGPADFIQTNIVGTFTLLEAVKTYWGSRQDVLFHHISTDEVFGSLGTSGFFTEETAYDPRSPYSASKAASDHLVRAYYHTFSLPITLTNCSNNYGPYQFPEKLIPLMINNALEEKALPVYGDGKNIRDWLFVEDHASAVWKVITEGRLGESYNVGGECEKQNIQVVMDLCEALARATGRSVESYTKLITAVKDRAGHDRRYAIDCSKIKKELGWKPSVTFEEGLWKTVNWYLRNHDWIDNVKSGDYQKWIVKNYN